MRAHPIYCDWCGALITETLIVYTNKYLQPHATFGDTRDSWDFCSDEHLTAWKDEAQMRRIAQSHSGRVVGPGQAAADEYRALLSAEIDERIAEALRGRRRPE